jgi:hypothetical protein
LEPVGGHSGQAATSRSTVSRRFVPATETALAQLLATDLSDLDLVVAQPGSASSVVSTQAGSGTDRLEQHQPLIGHHGSLTTAR